MPPADDAREARLARRPAGHRRVRAPALVCGLLSAALAIASCRSRAPEPALPEVRVHAAVGEGAGQIAAQLARARGVAAVRLVATPAEAEVFWLADPGEAIALGERVQAGALARDPAVDPRFVDAHDRFVPCCARARVLVRNPRMQLAFEPQGLRDLTDERVAGRVAVAALTTDEGAATIAGLTLSLGNASVSRYLAGLARNAPLVCASDAEVRERVARGEAALGLVGSEIAAAGAASAAGLEVIVPDQHGRGAIVLPTAVAVSPEASAAAKAFANWLAGPEAEQLLVARIPGLMPLREGVPVPVGVAPVGAVRSVLIDWDRYSDEKQRVRAALAGWPEAWRR